MRRSALFFLIVTLLIGGADSGWAMGSGPHPNLPYALPSVAPEVGRQTFLPGSMSTEISIGLVIALMFAVVLICAVRSNRRA
jgi:hypothetical protein